MKQRWGVGAVVFVVDDSGAGFYPLHQMSGQIGGDGSGLSDLEAAVNAAVPGQLLELHITAPFPWPEWVGPVKVTDAIWAAVSPFVRLRQVRTENQDLIIVWEA